MYVDVVDILLISFIWHAKVKEIVKDHHLLVQNGAVIYYKIALYIPIVYPYNMLLKSRKVFTYLYLQLIYVLNIINLQM